MSQLQIVKFDPETEKMESFKAPIPESQIGSGHLTMIDPLLCPVDGKIWINIAEGTDESGGTWHVDLATNTWTKVTYPPGQPVPRAYDVVADSKNNMYGMNMSNNKIWTTDGKTLKTAWYDLPNKEAGCRRGHIDSQDRTPVRRVRRRRFGDVRPQRRRRSPSGNLPRPARIPMTRSLTTRLIFGRHRHWTPISR